MPDSAPDTPAFSRLHPTVQEALYRMRWTHLRPIQAEAIREVYDGDGDLIVAARTASGKTEAAFLPILSRIVAEPKPGVRAIYAGPLKALINDQFLRLERLCEIAEIPVHKWHGDVGAEAKKRLLDEPGGVLLITPESIESLFVNHSEKLASLFINLGFVVIDEMHAFLGIERGAHLKSLISRLSGKVREPVRRVGLSATLGDMDAARRWLRSGAPDRVHLIQDATESKAVRLRLSGYLIHPNEEAEPEEEDDGAISRERQMAVDLFDAFHGRTALIFANRKPDIEAIADFARRESARRGLPDLFRVHHGSLSKGEREDTEAALRSGRPTATVCSSTLEMGIDVGDVSAVGQVGPPWSVASMVQRLGRSGRKEGEAQEMRVFVEQMDLEASACLVDLLFPRLLQGIAMTELMIAEHWCEPPEVDRLHLSTLVQQVLSVIAELGGARADRLHAALVEKGAFTAVEPAAFLQVLRDMGAADLIEQSPEGVLILGLKGEKIVRHHDFYLAFQVVEEYRVTHDGRHIGNIAVPPNFDDSPHLILAGRRWKVIDVDAERRSIRVEPSPGGRVPHYRPPGLGEIHPRVRQMMKAILSREDVPIYLDPGARSMLARARASAREAGLHSLDFLQEGGDFLWFTWTGTRIQRTLSALATHFGGLHVEDEGVALRFKTSDEPSVRDAYRGILDLRPDPEVLATKLAARPVEKYEPYLSEPLRARVYGRERLDLDGAIGLLEATIFRRE